MKCNCEGNGDAMKKEQKEVKEENKVNFDLSTLTLEELVEVYDNIKIFIDYFENFLLNSTIFATRIRNY